MKRIASVMIALFAVLLISACAKQRDEAPKNKWCKFKSDS